MTLKISAREPDAHKKAAEIIKNGGVAIVPTETVYGFAVDVFNIDAQRKIYKIKGRSQKKPLILMAYNVEGIRVFVDIPKKALEVTKKFWPGQLTLIFSTTETGKMVSGGRKDLGVRIPNNVFMLKLLREIKTPIFTTSVNISTKNSLKSYEDVLDFNGIVDIIVDGDKCEFSFESTVIDMVQFPYVIIRKGCLNSNELLKYIIV
jgi:L-threonylcarbamoyladenylate synthase